MSELLWKHTCIKPLRRRFYILFLIPLCMHPSFILNSKNAHSLFCTLQGGFFFHNPTKLPFKNCSHILKYSQITAAVKHYQRTTSCLPVQLFMHSFVPPVSVDLGSFVGFGWNRLISAEDSLMNKATLRYLNGSSHFQCTQ